MPPSAKPTWNEVFFFPLRLPPLCDAIELDILSGSKVLGTATLHLSHISSAGAELEGGVPGFLPCFGPSFLPFYGARRDAAAMPSDAAVAYRGRVLLEISTHTGDSDGRQQDSIAPEDVTRVQRLLPRRHRLGLCAVFYSATMLSPTSEPLRFELSIGNHGDTGDTSCLPAASATPQGHPLFDGNRYYYMPWHDTKPVVAVTSTWEDAGQRWDAQNLLHLVGERLAQQPDTRLDTELRAARLLLLQHLITAATAGPPRQGWATLLPEAEAWLSRVAALQAEAPGHLHAQLRVRLWLGRVAESQELPRYLEGPLHVYAETYENQMKILGKWSGRALPGCSGFSDITGRAGLPRERFRPPKGWRWDGPWAVEPPRRLLPDPEVGTDEVLEEVYENQSRQRGGEWGPAAVPSTDVDTEGKQVAAAPKGRGHTQQPKPVILCTFQRPSFFQLRCYLFQALELKPHSTKATAGGTPPRVLTPQQHLWVLTVGAAPTDPVAHVSFVHISQSTRVLPGTLDPVWDQALLFHRVLLYGDPRGVQEEPPAVVVEVFDQDGGDGALAQLSTPPWRKDTFSIPPGIRPVLRLMALEVLAWGLRGLRGRSLLPVRAPSLEVQCGGQVLHIPPITDLAVNPNFPINTFLLTLHLPVEEEYVPPIRLRVLDTQSFGYRPQVGQACVQGLACFCRDPNGEEQLPRPCVPVSGPNPGTTLSHLPPLPLSHPCPLPTAAWGRIAQVSPPFASYTCPHPQQPWLCRCVPPPPVPKCPLCFWQMLPRVTAEKGAADKDVEREEEDEEEGDWWSKFYTAMGDTAKSHRGTHRDSLKVYSCELEAVPEFEGLQDFCQTFPLYQPGGHQGDDPVPVGEFKGLFHLYPLPEDPRVLPPPRHFQELPPSQPQQCLVRVYIVRAFDLSPRDRNGLCDPYVRVSLGTKTLGQRDQYVPSTVEPVFGRMFEVTGTVPLEKDLRVSLLDHDVLPPDQEIGSTTIDLENRLLSRFRAHCGLPRLYRTWVTPTPEWGGGFGTGAGEMRGFGVAESGPPMYCHPGAPRERLALHVLHSWHLVPEHLETRTLHNSAQPGLEQGKVQMWVDIFPANLGPPGPPVDITPRKPQRYELRCVVWNTRDVEPGDTSATGQRMSDIYVTGWLDGLEEQKQRTDVHYHVLQGDGSFHWRFVFPFQYQAAERCCVLPRKEHFWSLDETVLKLPPKLILQVWDNDKFSADDFLGVLELELTRLPRPAQRPQDCTLKPRPSPWPWGKAQGPLHFSLFRQKQARGWWPCMVHEGGTQRLTGKLELSLELLNEKEAKERPAGKGREEPNAYPTLQPPERPDSSFLWLWTPLRALHYAVWRRHRCRFAITVALLLLLLLLLAFIYSTPGYMAMKLVNPLQGVHLSGAGSKH
ncbi:hypothetical protein ASZ78_009279 [Callipepla squamata]|uniref:C2 domain-containing protein n=1 Tax=Callipepla squamata TaxID=9009 RepID=A0A226MD04_CALSU|nr:hypothetical protein ASZ78_009279 [Callipepla squamata]